MVLLAPVTHLAQARVTRHACVLALCNAVFQMLCSCLAGSQCAIRPIYVSIMTLRMINSTKGSFWMALKVTLLNVYVVPTMGAIMFVLCRCTHLLHCILACLGCCCLQMCCCEFGDNMLWLHLKCCSRVQHADVIARAKGYNSMLSTSSQTPGCRATCVTLSPW